jgi:FkbH-like protein
MYELEIAHSDLSNETLSAQQKALFRDHDAEIVGVSLIPWEEHCTECAMPACFSTCDLYEERPDGKCRRFTHGIRPMLDIATSHGHAVRIQFKRWAQLMAYANTRIVPIEQAQEIEKNIERLDAVATNFPGRGISIAGRRNIPARMQRRFKQWTSQSGKHASDALQPDYFVVEIFNPAAEVVQLTLRLVNPGADGKTFTTLQYQERLDAQPGFNRFKFDCPAIFRRIDASAPIHITIAPNETDDASAPPSLYFGSLGFVADLAYRRKQAAADAAVSDDERKKPVKIVIWDLDNTVWDGVLVEDGPAGIRLKPGIEDVIRTLDSRGIVNSVASKNDHDHAMEQLARFGLKDYFVFGRISWDPKGAAVSRIVKDFNVGADAVVFIDDQPFERDQVKQIEPKVRTIDALHYRNVLDWPGFNPSVSAESAGRRMSYVNQKERDSAEEQFGGDYTQFLRECRIELTVMRSASALLDRLHELVQRTNQLNFSGRRYSRDEIDTLLHDPQHDHFALSCRDRYGDYGVIAFALVDKRGALPMLRDMMMSCRVQSKRVEHAFFHYLMNLYKAQGYPTFEAVYHKTDRNAPAGRVFDDIGFTPTRSEGNVVNFKYELTGDIAIPDIDVVNVIETGGPQ